MRKLFYPLMEIKKTEVVVKGKATYFSLQLRQEKP